MMMFSLILLFATSIQAATLEFDYTVSFGTDPVGTYPAATAVFDDENTEGSVILTFTVGDIGDADITQIYFNLDPTLDATLLTITELDTSATVVNDILLGNDLYQADGDGDFDILIDLSTVSTETLSANETITFLIEGTDLTADSFDFWSVNSPTSSYLSAIKVQSTDSVSNPLPDTDGSDWVGVVPVPAAAWLFGSALLGMVGVARRRT
jgi:hypothetical protein